MTDKEQLGNNVQAIIFDLDGVLCSTIEYHYQSWKLAVAAYGLPFSREVNEKLRGLTRAESLRLILDDRVIPAEWFEDILDLKGRYYEEFVRRMTPADLAPGAGPLLKELRQAGLKVGVASSSRFVVPVLQRIGILNYMNAVVDGRHFERSKPAPDAFLQAALQLGIDPASCLAIEDSPEGVESAHAAGMPVVGLGAAGPAEERMHAAEAVFPDLSSIRLRDLLAVAVSAAPKYQSATKDQSASKQQPAPDTVAPAHRAPSQERAAPGSEA